MMKEFTHSHDRSVSLRNICICALLVGAWFTITLSRTVSPLASLGLWIEIPLRYPLTNENATTVEERIFRVQEGPKIFSPKDLLELGRPGIAVANDAGDLAFVPFSRFSIEDKRINISVFVVSLESKGKTLQIPLESGGESFWLSSRTLAVVVQGEQNSSIYAYDISLGPNYAAFAYESPVLLGTLPSKTAANFRYNADTGNLVFSTYVYSDGNLSTVAKQDKEWEESGNTAMVFDKTYVRHWDKWEGPKDQQLFVAQLKQQESGFWALGDDIKSPLQGTQHYSPIRPFGGLDNFDASDTHIIYTTRDPRHLNAWEGKLNIYLVPVDGERSPVELTSGKQSTASHPIFNRQGTKVAWLEQDEMGHDADRTKIVIFDLEKQIRFRVAQHWDRSPESIAFSKNDEIIYLTAGDEAKTKIFALPVPSTPSRSSTDPKFGSKYIKPVAITSSKAASGVQVLSDGKIVFTQSSFTSPNDVFVASGLKAFRDAMLAGSNASLSKVAIERITDFSGADLKHKELDGGEEFWFRGARNKRVQGWKFKPKDWTVGDFKKWPVVLIVHGGPQSAWEDQWSTRWNPNVFAQQGYFVIMINPTGSTTFGQEFSDAINGDWGGKPFFDLILGWKHILRAHPEIDADRAVAAGASWGGYAMNWIQSHPEFGFGFKALVCHDGVFDSTYLGYSTDELSFFEHEWGGKPWNSKARRRSDKNSPASFVRKWSTPELLIHGSNDYRVPETESIGPFHALQQLGIPSRLVVFPDENHWVLKQGNSLKWHYEVFRWFDQYVGKN